MPVSVIVVEAPQDFVAGADRPATRAEQELMGVAMVVEPDLGRRGPAGASWRPLVVIPNA